MAKEGKRARKIQDNKDTKKRQKKRKRGNGKVR